MTKYANYEALFSGTRPERILESFWEDLGTILESFWEVWECRFVVIFLSLVLSGVPLPRAFLHLLFFCVPCVPLCSLVFPGGPLCSFPLYERSERASEASEASGAIELCFLAFACDSLRFLVFPCVRLRSRVLPFPV